jgi:hypothetical protein
MRQEQIEYSKDTTELLDSLGLEELKKPIGQVINLDGKTSPAVLAGLLGVNVQLIYQYRQDGKLPPNSDASYRDCIKHYTLFWKERSIKKANNVSEAAMLQKIQLDKAKTEREWLSLKKEKGELIDTKELYSVMSPIITRIRQQCIAIIRKYPETQVEVDALIAEWLHLGENLQDEAQKELDSFIEEEMNKELDLGTADD